jgi:hypothetical protein
VGDAGIRNGPSFYTRLQQFPRILMQNAALYKIGACMKNAGAGEQTS